MFITQLQELERELQTGNLERGQVNRALTELRKNFKDGIPECGADSLRMALCSQPFKGFPDSIPSFVYKRHEQPSYDYEILTGTTKY